MKRFSNILYCYDKAIDQSNTFKNAVELAKNNQAKLTITDVIPNFSAGHSMIPNGPVSAKLVNFVKEERLQAFQKLIDSCDTSGLEIDQVIHTGAKKFIEIIRAVIHHKIDLVIKPAENPDWIDRLFGSEDLHLLRKCPCPVWLMNDTTKDHKRIVACVDFDVEDEAHDEESLLNDQILSLAFSAALSYEAELHIIHTWDSLESDFISLWAENPKKAKRELDDYTLSQHRSLFQSLMKTFEEKVGKETFAHVAPKTHLVQGKPDRLIPELAKELETDLVVMGTIARTGLPGLIIGNTAETIIDQLNCSLLAIKPASFVSPVEEFKG